jgi:hypothetical protein
MDRDTAITLIRRHETELKDLGVVSLSLFGSTARGTAKRDSDVDVAVRAPLRDDEGGFAYLGRLDRIEACLSQILGRHVDVVPEPVKRERFQEQIDRDRCVAF